MHFSIQSFFEKYKSIKNPKDEKMLIARIISESSGVSIEGSQISMKNSTLSINANSYIKTEIFLSKEKIQEALNNNKFYFKEIR